MSSIMTVEEHNKYIKNKKKKLTTENNFKGIVSIDNYSYTPIAKKSDQQLKQDKTSKTAKKEYKLSQEKLNNEKNTLVDMYKQQGVTVDKTSFGVKTNKSTFVNDYIRPTFEKTPTLTTTKGNKYIEADKAYRENENKYNTLKKTDMFKKQQEAINAAKTEMIEKKDAYNNQKKENDSKRKWFDKGAFNDGYQFGDITRTALGTGLDVGTNLLKGVLRAGESIGDVAAYGGAQIVDWFGADDYANQVRKAAAEDLTGKVFSNVDKTIDKNSVLGEKTDDVVSSIGNMYAQAVTSAKLLGGKGNIPLSIGGKKFNLPVTSIISGASSGMANAVNKNAEDWQIWVNGATSGLFEGLSESLFGTFGIGGSDLDDAIVNGITKNMKNALAKSLTKAGIKATGEGAEEVASYLLNYGSQHIIDYAKNNLGIKGVDLGEEFSSEELWENFFSGALAAGLGGLPSTISSIRGNQPSGININEGVIQFNRTNAINQNLQINNSNNNQQLNKQQNNSLNQQYSQNSNINQNIFQFEQDNNVKINNFKESASKYFNNSDQTHNFIDNMSKIISDKDYNVIFDDKIVNNKGQSVNAQIKTLDNGEVEVRINPNSPQSGEFLIIHEVTHAIETKEMIDLVLDYASKHNDFNQALNDLKANYGTDDISSEVLADISGQLFGNQEFINNLSLEKPSVFKRIYNSIISLANKITGNSHEALFIKDLKNKWETAYRNNINENISNLKFSKQYYENIGTIAQYDGINYMTNSKENIQKNIKDYFNNNFRGLEINQITTDPGRKYAYPGKRQNNYVEVKAPAVTIMNDIIETMTNKKHQPDMLYNKDGSLKKHSNLDTTGGFNHYDVKIGIPDNNGYVNIFSADSITRIDKNGIEYFYDLDKIKDTGQKVVDNKSKPITDSSVSFNGNNIAQSKENVKLPTKYSMQNSQNNVLINSEGTKIDISNLKENPTMERVHYNRKYDKNNIVTYRGETEKGGTGVAFYGLGLYTTLDKNYAKKFGNVKQVDNNLLPNNPLKFKTQNDFQLWEQELAKELGIRKNKLYSENYGVEQYVKKLGYDGLMIGSGKDTDLISFTNSAIKYSNENTGKWQEYLDKHYKTTGTRTNMNDIKIPTSKDINKVNMPSVESKQNNSKISNPIEISQLTPEDANTTPKLPKVKRNSTNDGKSKFANNVENKVNMLNEEQKTKILSDKDSTYYDAVTNKESLEKAFDRLEKNNRNETMNWFNKPSENANSTDVAEGWILLKQYADSKNYDGMVEVAKKLREIGTKAGQTVQAFNIMERMTPEGMVKYAQSELQEAYDKMVKNKSREWIDKYRSDFELKPEEVQFIMDNMKEISTMEDGYDKRVKLAEIQKLMTDKLPPAKGSGIKSWMRISMLFNPKTQVRNVVGNAIIMPVNSFSDLFSSYADKIISKKTGIRTTGKTNVKAMLKGMKEGAYQATNDYKKGINTKDMSGNRFEITEGKNFNDKTLMGKSLNRVEGMLNYVMDAGDRVFSQAAFENSLQNQMVLNNTTEITQDMIDIARTESLQRTWNDNNSYTKFVLDVRRMMNKINLPGMETYGLGDVLIPFAKTPANLTKAIVDYSPLGLVNTIVEGNNLRKSIANGQFTPQIQHKFVQDLGKATAGTMLYVLGYALAKSGVISGESDDDKDVSNFLKNTLGISSYSVKIGNKSFTYDWAQPIAAPLSIMANVVNSKNNKGQALTEAIVGSLDTAGSILLEQSFLQSINDVLNDNDGVVSGLINEMLELPARAVPTFSKQIADMVDGTQRTSFEYGKPIQSAVNSFKAKIPFVSKTLAPTVDTMGREVQKYGGKNNIFNVFLNPANVNTENISESAKEIYRLYKEVGNSTIMPRVAPYYINKGEKILLNSNQRAEFQKISGSLIEKEVKNLLSSKDYASMSDKSKSDIISDIVNYSYNIAQKDLLGMDISKDYKKAYDYSKTGNVSEYYALIHSIDNTDSNTKRESIKKFLTNSNLSDKKIAKLYGNYYSSEKTLDTLLTLNIPIKEYIKLDSADIQGKYNSKTGKTISGSKKQAVMQYINTLNLSVPQKAILIKMNYNSFDQYNGQIINYVKNLNETTNDKKVLLKQIGFDDFDKDVVNYINSQKLTKEEKESKLKDLGFTIRNGRVYW